MKRHSKYFFGLLASLLLMSFSIGATVVKPINLDMLTGLASVIVKARVTDVQYDLDLEESGRMVAYYTLEVLETLKGDGVGTEITFKQLADGEYYSDSGQPVRQRTFFPTYQVGKTYVLFLPEAHQVTGLLAPIGLFQGVFEVNVDEAGLENIPALKARARILQKDISSSDNRFLRLNQSKINSDHSYQTLKSLVQESIQN